MAKGREWGIGRGAPGKGEHENDVGRKTPTGTSGEGDKTAMRRRPDRVARERSRAVK